jgi:diguanylate cyclase (GGDEF)-like protein
MNLVAKLEPRSRLFWAITGLIAILVVGGIDFLTGHEIAFSLFYLVPISALTWYAGKRLGLAASIASALIWLLADIASGQSYSHPVIYLWNSLIRLSFFLIVTLLLSTLKKTLNREQELARIDNLTGAVNGRFFSDLLMMEIGRAQRTQRPFTLVSIDLDNFKSVNDQFGHSTGDQVLRAITHQARNQLRKTDIIARLGGDEFAFLLPETDQAAAQVALQRVHTRLMEDMNQNHWPVTFSIGVLTCIRTNTPQTSDELLKRADAMMYSVKNTGKNSIRYSVYAG